MKHLAVLLLIGSFFGCTEFTSVDELTLDGIDASYALPIFDSSFGVLDALEISDIENSFIRIGTDDAVTVFYSGELIKEFAETTFPPFPGFLNLPVLDTNVVVASPIPINFDMQQATFKESNIYMGFTNPTDELIALRVTVPDLKKDGLAFEQVISLLPNQTFETGAQTIDGYTLFANFDDIRIVYEARNAAGERLTFDDFRFGIDIFRFSFAEGFFGSNIYDIRADNIPIGIFDNWESGGIDFSNPQVILQVDNSYGFPVRTVIRQLELLTINDEIKQLESIFIDEGIEFNYPRLDDVGGVETTFFTFDNDNSNLGAIFNEKVKQVDFDIDAEAFPDGFEGEYGWLTDSSFFSISVAVELPVIGTIDDLILAEDFDFDIGDVEDEIKSAEIKLILKNGFPIDIALQGTFIDEAGHDLAILFDDGPLEMSANSGEQTYIIPIDAAKTEIVKNSSRIRIRTQLNNGEGNAEDEIIITGSNKIDARMGIIIKYQR